MKNIKKWLLGLAIFPMGFFAASSLASASQIVAEWYFGDWDCYIDGRPAQMQWYAVDEPPICSGNLCTITSGLRVVGRFSDSGSAWVPLARQWATSSELSIRYLGNEQDDWYLSYNSGTQAANGWTTWRGTRYPLQCRKR